MAKDSASASLANEKTKSSSKWFILEPKRDWVYLGQATHGVAAFLELGQRVAGQIVEGISPCGQVFVLATPKDHTANNRTTASLINLWHQAGTDVVTYKFDASLDIPHNSVDPAADPAKKQLVYDKI
jgi:hypothetical protein